MLQYVISFGIVALVSAVLMILPQIVKKYKLEALFAVTAKAVEIVEQETKRPEDETEEERLARQKKMKADAIETSKMIAQQYGLSVPSDEVLGYAVEAGVLMVNQIKKLTNKQQAQS